MRKVLIVTGSRSDYGNLRPLLYEISKEKVLELFLVVTGAHLSEEYGHTIDEIKKDGFPIYSQIPSLSSLDTPLGRIETISKQLSGLIGVVAEATPDIIVGFGDREEPLNSSLIANYLRIPFFHISGGDYAWGNTDDMIRHSISKIAHVHLVSNKESQKRLVRMGEETWRIYNTGLPAIDVISKKLYTKKNDIYKKFNISPQRKTVTVLNHPTSSDLEGSTKQIKTILDVLSKFDVNKVVIYPDTDPGSKRIIKNIEESREDFKIFPSLHHYDYLGLLNISSCLIGNSSSGIIESAYFQLPTINIGNREIGRLNGGNVKYIFNTYDEIVQSINECLFNKNYVEICKKAKRHYGSGKASEAIVKIIKEIELDGRLLDKKNTY